jgi:phage terminase large subunit
MNLKIQATKVFETNYKYFNDDKYRYVVNQGGSRSSKTYSILQLLIVIALKDKVSISIVRQSLPSLRSSVMRDFFEILKNLNLYDEISHQKTEHIYRFKNGSSVEFFSTDSEQKIRGRKRDILYCNEGNELNFDVFNQLVLRTKGKVFLDFNPSDTEHWIYELIKQDNCILIKSTYKDNPFLEKDQVIYIENLINVDENYYKIYALGERPISQTRIYTHFKQYVDEYNLDDYCYGLDQGYNHPMAIVKASFVENKVYIKEVLYKSNLTASDLIREMDNLNIDKRKPIYCDSARPELIEDLRRAGYNAKSSDKSVKEGIDKVKSMEIFIHHESTNLWREYKLYSWKTNGEIITDEPVKLYDDGLDAMRYAIYSHHKMSRKGKYVVV